MRAPAAKRGGLDVSLFKMLSDACPQAVTDLSMQYRMNDDIMTLSNKLVYDGRLKCDSEEVAKQTLVLPNMECGESHRGTACWIQDLMQES